MSLSFVVCDLLCVFLENTLLITTLLVVTKNLVIFQNSNQCADYSTTIDVLVIYLFIVVIVNTYEY